MIQLNSIYNMDCLEGLLLLKDSKIQIDAIITDPPYNVSQKSNFHTMGRQGVDFGEWDKEADILSWIPLSLDVLKKGGNIIIFNDWKNMSYIKDVLIEKDCLIKQILIWKKTNPMPRNTKRLYVTTCEFAIWATKGTGWTFNYNSEKVYENAIFEYSAAGSGRIHPTQKPVKLIEEIVTIHTNAGDTILDPFMGSATTAVACKNLDRNFVGFELNEDFYNQSIKRLEILE